jgi:dihydrodipicolinate synthase/N-acetylneuraminate lyase
MHWRERIRQGCVIPAHPLALNAARKIDERRQRALTRYYCESGAGGIAVGVHTTQFEIRRHGLFEPVLDLAAQATREHDVVLIAGICGPTSQAVREAELAARRGYQVGLLSLAALRDADDDTLIDHARAVGEIIPLFGFYLQPAVGGRVLPYSFWRRFVELDSVVAIKVAPFNRYQTLDVVRALAESGRAGEVALYTGNDDHIVLDLLSPWFVGGLLGHWAFWTRRAVELLDRLGAAKFSGAMTPDLLALADQTTDANAAAFDAVNNFRGCIPGIHEMLRRQGLLEGRWCLNEHEELSPGQMQEIDRVCRMYPWLNDDEFVKANIDRWLR